MSSDDAPPKVARRRSLRGKVTVLLLAIGLGPLFIAGGVNINRAVERGKALERQRLSQAARFAAVAVTEVFDRARDDVWVMARRFPVETFDFDRAARILDDTDRRLPTLDAWRDAPLVSALSQDFDRLFTALPDGQVFYTSPFSNVGPVDLSRRPWFEALAERGGLVPGPLPPLTTPERPGAVVFAPLLRRGGKLAGYVGAIVPNARLGDIIGRALAGLGGQRTSVAIVEPSGRIAAHSEAGRVGTALEGELWAHRTDGTGELDLSARAVVAAWADVGRVGWKVVLVTPRETAYRPVYGLIWMLVIVIALTLVFVLLLADLAARLLLDPIHELEQGAQMIGTGALDYRIDLETHTHARDELGRLARRFNQMAESLQDSQQQQAAYGRSLETARKELDAIVFGITHDLKKSLRGIEAFASFLGEDYAEDLDDDGLEMLASIAQNVDRINALADDLIGLVEHDREAGEPVEFEMQALLEEVEERAKRFGGEIVVVGDMPRVTGDRAGLLLVFTNLVENGLKFNRTEHPQVTISCHDDFLSWRFDVLDNGIGIDPRYAERVFELFARLNHQDAFPGNGTGLNLARRIVEEHRGQLSLTPVPDGGTCFHVTLPKRAEALAEPSIASWKLPGDSGDVDPLS